MPPTIKTDGSQTATLTTEHTLATITDPGTYVLAVDVANLVKGDELILRIKTKIRVGGTSRLAYYTYLLNAQAELASYSVPVPSPVEFVATLQQQAGSAGRAFPWAVYAL